MQYIVGNRIFETYDEAYQYCILCDYDPSIMIEEEKKSESVLYWYQYLYRGFSPFCQPDGYVKVKESIGKWGIIAYNRPLTKKELNEYELVEYKGEII